MKVILFLMTIMASMAIFASCQSPKTVQIIIHSEPQGAIVYIDSDAIGQTPIKRDITFKKPKKERHLIQVKKEGYKTQQRYFHYTDNPNQLFQLYKE